MATKQLDITNRTYNFHNDLINLSNFSINNSKLDKKHGEILIFIILAMLIKVKLKIDV